MEILPQGSQEPDAGGFRRRSKEDHTSSDRRALPLHGVGAGLFIQRVDVAPIAHEVVESAVVRARLKDGHVGHLGRIL